ncbi:MAG: hypothetical protein [Olavius algarvensis Gamma 1 endosymbiont]|nr:MAG: hypothetical protein [Olavius algarvensis Gamma 1 endosymbiont]
MFRAAERVLNRGDTEEPRIHTNRHEDSYFLVHEFFVHGRHGKTRKGERCSFSCFPYFPRTTLSSLFVSVFVVPDSHAS